MARLTREEMIECAKVMSTTMLMSVIENSDKDCEEYEIVREEIVSRLDRVDPTSRRSKGYVSICRRNNNGKKSMQLEVKDHGFNTLYTGDMTLEDFAEFVTGCEVKIQREE